MPQQLGVTRVTRVRFCVRATFDEREAANAAIAARASVQRHAVHSRHMLLIVDDKLQLFIQSTVRN
jgi:hypothetical protein